MIRSHPSRLRLAVAAGLALFGVALALVAVGRSPAGAQGGATKVDLPDIVQVPPYKVAVRSARVKGRTHRRLIFASAAEVPRGFGRLIAVGHRPSTSTSVMTVDQYIDVIDSNTSDVVSQQVVRNVGRMRYVFSHDHEHFHYLGFERYTLRRVRDNRRMASDRKTGFCLGDRYQIASGSARSAGVHGVRRLETAGVIRSQDLDQDCGSGETKRLEVKEGITPGNGDDYKPNLEGQYLDITSVPAGRYWLIHQVNADRKLQETRYDNDTSSALIDLRRPKGKAPTVKLLKRCPSTARCK